MSGVTHNADGSEKKRRYGRTIVNGEVRFTSVSALEKADSSSSTGCLRKWWYHYKQSLREPPSPATERGERGHAEIRQYLTSGERGQLSTLVLAGMHQLPPPGDDLLVEHDLVPDMPDGTPGLALAKLHVDGIPLIGAMDLCHAREENYGVQDPSADRDEPGVLKIIDHKFTGNIKNAKAPHELPKTFQMAGYGLWGFETFPDLERVRLSHNYFPVTGTPRVSTILVDREPLEETWKRATSVGVSIRHAAREANPDLIDANTGACRSYGRDCPAIHICRANRHNSLASIVGVTAAERLLGAPRVHLPILGDQIDMTTPTPIVPNSLIAQLKAKQAAANAAAVPANAPVAQAVTTPAPAPVPTPAQQAAPSAAVQAEIQRLADQEAAGDIAPPTPAQEPILQVLADIEACGLGLPAFEGQAAADIAAAAGIPLLEGGMIPGSTDLELGKYTISDPAQLVSVRDEVRRIVATRAAAVPAAPATATSDAPVEEPKKKTRGPRKKADEPAAVPQSPAAQVPVQMTIEAQAVASVATATVAQPEVVQQPTSVNISPQPSGPINVFVDCVVDGMATKSLWPLVDELCQNMSTDAATPGGDGQLVVTDFRSADPNGKYGFGRWRGVLAACLRESPAYGKLPPGNYTLDGAMGEIGGVVAETMRQIARATGGVYVKGAR
ncbi:MAG: hypothetical protein ACTHU0_17070 [Kofleriaceae bacterium]